MGPSRHVDPLAIRARREEQVTPRRLMDAAAIERALAQMAEGLHARPGEGPFAVVGIRRGGVPLAARLAAFLGAA